MQFQINLVRSTSKFVQDKKRYEYNLVRKRRPKRKKDNLGNKGKNKGEYNLVDRISQLPDDVLVSILSLLPLKEAAATSILSRRWQYVWLSTMTLNFDARFDVGNTYHSFNQLPPELRNQERHRYVNWVNRVVEQHTGTTIEQFRVCFVIDCGFESSIDKWIQFAMNKRVQILDLHFITTSDDAYPFPQKLLGLEKESALKPKHLDPEIPSLHSSCGYNAGFKFLKVLHFRNVGVTGEVLEHFLSNCPVLERLTVQFATRSLVNLRVVRPSVALKYLAIKQCLGLKSIEICDANLVSFIYVGKEIDLLLSNVPSLVEVYISERHVAPNVFYKSIELSFTQLSCCLSQLEILTVDIDGAVYNRNHVFPILSNLKHLELIVLADYPENLHLLASFMKAAPYLQRLLLKVRMSTLSSEKRELESAAKCPHNYLKVVEIVGYRVSSCVIQHVMFLMSIAALEKIVIDPVQRWRLHRGIEDVKEEVEARDHAMQHLKEKVPSTVEFVCL